MGTKTIAAVAGVCLGILGCGESPGETTGTGGGTTAGTGGGGGEMCAATQPPGSPLACKNTLHNSVEKCPLAQLGRLTAAPTEDGDLAVERLVAQADLSVNEIVLELDDGNGSCALPPEVEVIYFVGDAQAPVGSAFTEAKVPKASAYRIDDAHAAFSVTVSPTLLVPAGKALYAGIRQHPSPATCIAYCKGEGAAPGQSWWGHTHKQPGEVVWATLASEGFTVSLRVTAIIEKK